MNTIHHYRAMHKDPCKATRGINAQRTTIRKNVTCLHCLISLYNDAVTLEQAAQRQQKEIQQYVDDLVKDDDESLALALAPCRISNTGKDDA